MSDTNEIQIDFDELIDRILVVPSKSHCSRTADFIFGKYKVDLDLRKACCEKYYIYLNGKDFTLDKKYDNTVIKINPSSSVTFTFGEKKYHHRKDWCFIKNYMVMKFSGGDRIRTNRDEQYDGPTYANIYTRGIYLDYDDKNTAHSRLLGFA